MLFPFLHPLNEAHDHPLRKQVRCRLSLTKPYACAMLMTHSDSKVHHVWGSGQDKPGKPKARVCVAQACRLMLLERGVCPDCLESSTDEPTPVGRRCHLPKVGTRTAARTDEFPRLS